MIIIRTKKKKKNRLDLGIVGGGYYFEQGKLKMRVGLVATIWDKEIAGLEQDTKGAGNRDWHISGHKDSKAAI